MDIAVPLIIALSAAAVGWLLSVLWELYRGPRVIVEKVTVNNPDDFAIRLRNVGHREASECIVVVETRPLSEAKVLLNKLKEPTGRRMNSYILEELDADILYSCWPITRDVILPDMTDMKPGATYDFVSRLPDFLRQKKKEDLKEGDWERVISLPKESGVYTVTVSVYDGLETSFLFIYEHLDMSQTPKMTSVGTIRKPRIIGTFLVRPRLWLAARKYR